MTRRLFASDLDGTLFGLLHKVDGTVLRAIREVTDAGSHFAIATGRTMRTPHDFGFDGVSCDAVCANGAIVLGRDGEMLRHVAIDPAFVEELLHAFPTIPFDCIGLEHTYVRGSREAFEASGRPKSPWQRVLLRGMRNGRGIPANERLFGQTDAQVLSHEIVKLNARLDDEGLIRDLHAFLDERRDLVVNAPFSPVLFEITERSVNKGEAVAWLAEHLGLGEDDVTVYGDGGNDVVMLERFAEAYVPRGACEDAKHAVAANHVLGSNVLHAVPRHMRATVRTLP